MGARAAHPARANPVQRADEKSRLISTACARLEFLPPVVPRSSDHAAGMADLPLSSSSCPPGRGEDVFLSAEVCQLKWAKVTRRRLFQSLPLGHSQPRPQAGAKPIRLNVILLKRQSRIIYPVLTPNSYSQNDAICIDNQVLNNRAVTKLYVHRLKYMGEWSAEGNL